MIRQCTLGTLGLESSMKEFNKLETELSKSICSYLTCERYWENDLERTRHLSTTFIVVSLLFLVCLFSICYYLVWSFFEAEEPYDLQLAVRIRTACSVLSLANLVRLVRVVNLAKCKWLCKKESNENKETKDSLDEDSLELKSEFKDEILLSYQNPQTKLPFKMKEQSMKQSIFSVRSSSSDSIKKMQQEHLRNLEIHEKRLREQEKLKEASGRKLSKQQIIEEEENQFDELDTRYPVDPVVNDQHGVRISLTNPYQQAYGAYGVANRAFNRQYNLTNHSTGNLRAIDQALLEDAELDREVYQHFNRQRFTDDGEIVSTKSKSEDKDSFYDKESFYECASVRKASTSDSANLANQFSKLNERKDQRRPSEQSSLCSYLTCPKAIRISTGDATRRSRELLNGRQPSGESGKELSCEESHFGDAKETSDHRDLQRRTATDGRQTASSETTDRPSDGQQQKSPRKRLWEIYGDITLLNQARMKLLEQRAASRQLNLVNPPLDENNQSNPICKKRSEIESKGQQIELKEFKTSKSDLNGRAAVEHRFDQSLSSSRSTSHNLGASVAGRNHVTKGPIGQNLDQTLAESRQRGPYKQSVSSSRSSSQTMKNYAHLVCKDPETTTRKPLINPILNQVIFHQQQTSRSQPPSLSQTPRPASTNSSPCNR